MLIEAGADVHAMSKGFAPLHCAAMVNPNPKIVLALLEAGAKVNAGIESGESPLYLACSASQRNPNIILLLLANGADANAKNFDGRLPLDFARSNKALIGTEAFQALRTATSMWNR